MSSLVDDDLNGGPISGAAKVGGVRRSIDLQLVEHAVQEDFASRDRIPPMDASASQKEHLQSRLMEWVMLAHEEVKGHGRILLEKLIAAVPTLMKYEGEITTTLSWPRHGDFDKLDACKVFLVKLILDEATEKPAASRGCYEDAIEDPPSKKPKSLFDSSLYDQDQIDEGFTTVIEKKVSAIEKKGGIHVMDTNNLVMNATQETDETDMVSWLVGRGWEEVYSCFNLTVMAKTENEDDMPRVIFVCRPWCWMLYSGCYQDKGSNGNRGSANWNEYESQATRAKTAHLLQAIILLLKSKKLPKDGKIVPQESFLYNFLTAFAMRVFLLCNFHIFPMHAGLFAKNMLWKFDNLFKTEYHGLAASSRGVTRRQQERWRRSSESTEPLGRRDKHQRRRMQNRLTLDDLNLPVRIEEVVRMICKNLPDNAYKKQGGVFRRLVRDYLQRGGITDMIQQQLLNKKKQEQGVLDQEQNVKIGEEKKDILARQKQVQDASDSSGSDF